MTRRNLTAADMRERLGTDLLVQKLFEREVVSKITVTDQDVTDFFNANRVQFSRTEDAYHIAQIVITPEREPRDWSTGAETTPPAPRKRPPRCRC